MQIDINEIAVGDIVHHAHYTKAGIIIHGRGEVIKCTETPSIKVQFSKRKMTFTEKNINQLTLA